MSKSIINKVNKKLADIGASMEVMEIKMCVNIKDNEDGTTSRIYENVFLDSATKQMLIDENGPRHEMEIIQTDPNAGHPKRHKRR